jgi:hypothetical protein
MSGKWTGASIVARYQAQLMLQVTYVGSVSGQAWDPPSGFLSVRLAPCQVSPRPTQAQRRGFRPRAGASRADATYLFQLTSEPATRGLFLVRSLIDGPHVSKILSSTTEVHWEIEQTMRPTLSECCQNVVTNHSPIVIFINTSQLPVLCYVFYISYKYVLRYLFKYNYY